MRRAAIDQAHLAPDDAARQEARAFVDYMIPIHKGWATEASIEVANLGIQVHGGMGFIEETGAAQYLRDARITTIYEGTTGIQANDLVGRKTAREGGSTARALIARMQATVDGIDPVDADMAIIRDALARGIQDYTACVEWIVATYGSDIRAVHAGAVPFLKLAGIVCGGWQLARAADIATRRRAEAGSDRDFLSAKVITARFYAEHLMSRVAGLRQTMIHGAGSTMALPVERF